MLSRILCISLLLNFGVVQAHQPDISSTVLAEQGDGVWILQIRAALTAYEYEIHHNYGQDSYATPEEFQDLVAKFVKENISIVFDDSEVVDLKNGVVRLGHETNTIFEVSGIPDNFKKVAFKNSSFKDISRNQSALIILKKGFSKNQFVLNNDNGHMAHLEVKDAKLVAVNASSRKTMGISNVLFGIGFLGVTGLLIFMFLKTKKQF